MGIEYRISPDLVELSRLRIWRIGRPAPIWLELGPLVQEFVKKNKLQPIPQEELFASDFAAMEMQEGAARTGSKEAIIPRRDFPGGLRFAHLHVARDIFRVDQRAWKEFSARALDVFRQKLASAESVTFDQIVELSEATSTLG